jgi:F-type H+-transporting ATPase subunit b
MDKILNDFSLGLFVIQILLFVGLFLLLKKYAWGPILDAVNEREDSIKDALAGAEKAKQEMQDLKSDNEKILKEARAERDAMLKDAREMKESMISEAKEEAKAQAQIEMDKVKKAIQNEKAKAITEMKNQMGELSVNIAEKVMQNELSNKDKQLELIESLLKDVTLN